MSVWDFLDGLSLNVGGNLSLGYSLGLNQKERQVDNSMDSSLLLDWMRCNQRLPAPAALLSPPCWRVAVQTIRFPTVMEGISSNCKPKQE